MLDNITKKNIDDCRDVLVGKVPDPKSQIEQITLALIYKFMDDMDKEAVEKFKGKAKFFTGEYAKYGWRKLFDPSLSGQDMLSLYSEALEKLNTNPNIPELFRNIFKNAYLPYRDPATLKLFLKHINEFEYSHSEKLGDAFEYLLSVMGSQGDAGQFRTPRHIIDFVTACVNPQKNETVLDPACGTAGFLLSAYKHILNQNTEKRLGDKLKPDDRKKLATNFVGYDISPDMVRLSLANMYLHGFATPQIHEYDTLSSEDRWQETFDVILANPPFMTPKGGIRPHKKFGVQANKAEVLFTDYIAEHLSSNGRAGIVVPNGIVATSQTAYKQLRKMLVQDSLIAVISLPAGVFQPYSGVKTSVLILDKRLAKKSQHILFLKIENDGFDLGAQRREIDKNDLPVALQTLAAYKECLSSDKAFDDLPSLATLVEKEIVLGNKDIVLSAERYFEAKVSLTEFELAKLEDICDVRDGTHDSPTYVMEGFPLVTSKNIIDGKIDFSNVNLISREDLDKINKRSLVEDGDIIMPMIGTIGNPIIVKKEREFGIKNVALIKFDENSKVNNVYLKYILGSEQINDFFLSEAKGVAQKYVSLGLLRSIEIPLPPLEIQQQIVTEIEGYQKIIDGAKQIVNNYKPTIKINPGWEMVELDKVCKIQSGGTPSKAVKEYWENGTVPWVGSTVCKDQPIFNCEEFITELGLQKSSAKIFPKHTTLIALVGATIGKTAYLEFETSTNQNIAGLQPLDNTQLDNKFLFFISQTLYNQFYKLGDGSFRMASLGFIKELQIPLPSMQEQQAIAQAIEEEMKLVNANKRLIEIFEQKIKDKISEVWGVKEEVETAI
ncbi:MAG: N-6 DNA methylase [Ferruginibacter sp.]|nr:N-6 DNA methylase [Ferruginibacter sp.]